MGYKDRAEYDKVEYFWNKGFALPEEFNEFFCKNPKQEFIDNHLNLKLERNKNYKIQLKMRCILNDSVTPRLKFAIGYDNTADYYILCGCNTREELNILHIWIFCRDETIREKKFWRRESLSISNKPEFLREFQNNELTDELPILKKLCEELKEEI